MLFNQNIAKINELDSVPRVYLYQKNSQNVIKTTIFPYICKIKAFWKARRRRRFWGVFFKEFFEFSNPPF